MGVTFTTTLEDSSGPIGIVVPEDAMAQLGPAKRYPVVVTIGGYSYRNSVSWYKGAYRIAFSAENRRGAGVSGGETLAITLEHDDAPRVLEIPAELTDALTSAGVLEAFTALSYSKQRTLVDPWAAAKTDATREKNLAKILAAAGA
jgi:hypothetical protein